jgi:hypothetical protein
MTYRRWLISTLLLIPVITLAGMLLLIGATIVAVREPNYLLRIPDPFTQTGDYAYSLRGQDCKVLIYGDSTAITGYDPLQIERETGLSTCNIARTRTVVNADGLYPVQQFLAQNAKPRYLVIQMAPETYHIEHNWEHLLDSTSIIDDVRHRPWRDASWRLFTHPKQMVNYFFEAMSNRFSPKRRTEPQAYRDMMDQILFSEATHKGFFVMIKTAEVECSPLRPTRAPVDIAWMTSVRQEYAAQGITVLFNVSPIPDCNGVVERTRNELSKYLDSPVEEYPISQFNDIDRHFTLEGAAHASHDLSQQILAMESKRHR